jgi:hypothetical protein
VELARDADAGQALGKRCYNKLAKERLLPRQLGHFGGLNDAHRHGLHEARGHGIAQ